jgi:hypothetical protein
MGGTLTRSESPRLLGELVVNSFVTIFCDPKQRHKIPTHAKLSFVVCLHMKSLFDNRKLRRLAGVSEIGSPLPKS